MRRAVTIVLLLSLLAAACSSDQRDDSAEEPTGEPAAQPPADQPTAERVNSPTAGQPADVDPASLPVGVARDFGPVPAFASGPLDADVVAAVDTLMGERLRQGTIDQDSFAAIITLGDSGDARVAWWLSDLLRITRDPDLANALSDAEDKLLGIEIDRFRPWGSVTNFLIGWDIPAPPDYLTYKRNPYLAIEPRWEPLFVDGTDIDWRMVSWGGVLIDDRPYNQTDEPCNCIPAADNPPVTDVAGGDDWLDDDTIVFGVVINDEPRAYPRSIMEVREMVNDTLGGRDVAMPYCTLCGSAQVYFTDELPAGVERPILRTSGLLTRSNKVMYDVVTFSIFDTFLGKAVSGPLAEAGVELSQNSVVTTTWLQWKTEHPDTTVLAIELANGRPDSDLRNTRDADGPIFPIGQVDTRLPVQEDVLGVLTAAGEPIAFHVNSAIEALERGEIIEVDGINVVLDGGGVKAIDANGNDLGGHQAFWFAWSQFYPSTTLWPSALP